MYVLLLSHSFFVLSHVSCRHHKGFVDVITTVVRLPHIEIKQE